MTILHQRRSNKLLVRTFACAALVVGACTTFDDPPNFDDDGTSGSGGNGGSSGDASTAGTGGTAGSDGGAGTGGVGPTGPWWPYQREDQCESAGMPNASKRPPADDPGTTLEPIYLAQTTIRIGTTTENLQYDKYAWQDIGFDQDGRCMNSPTCVDEETGEGTVEFGCRNPFNLTPQDGNNCRDNTIGKIFDLAQTSSPTMRKFFGVSEEEWNCEIRRGGFGAVYRLSGWNGKPNDTSVRVDYYTGVGTQNLQQWKCRERPDGGTHDIEGTLNPEWRERVSWNKGNPWLIARSTFDPADPSPPTGQLPNSKVYDNAAFVRNGYVYAKLTRGNESALTGLFGERTPIPGFYLTLNRPVMLGQLVKTGDGEWTIKGGILAGVVTPGQHIQDWQRLGFCQNMCFSYDQLISYLNENVDALSNSETPVPTADCDALSFSLAFEAREATVDAVRKADGYGYKDTLPPLCGEPRHPGAPPADTLCGDGGTQ